MERNRLLQLQDDGQSVWLDFIRRDMLVSGELQQLIEVDGVSGVTSNPSIFEKAIEESHDYDDAISRLARAGKSAPDIYQALVVDDIQRAADLLRPIYDGRKGEDGFVSLEVSPHLARETAGTIAEARRLWAAVDRPNVLIKVPGTQEGLLAIQQLISEGMNINVTLLFGLPRYREVAEAYIKGLEERARAGKPLEQTASVASFFLSRIDVLIDRFLAEKRESDDDDAAELASALQGKVAVASAKLAYQDYKRIFEGPRFEALAAQGAHVQRLLWASTSTKNPAYSDVKYVETLIGLHTVNTLPLETLNAYRDHGHPAVRLEEDIHHAQQVLQRLADEDIDLNQVTQQLEDEGLQKFVEPFDRLMNSLERKRVAALGDAGREEAAAR
jgi:transaldolase